MSKRFGAKIIGQVLSMKEQGISHRAIAEKFGLTKTQIRELVKRYNRKKRSAVVVAKHLGRPRARPVTVEQAYLQRIRQLEMEVELYRTFLQAAGRM
jgi:transposase